MSKKRGLCHLIALAMTAATFLWVLCFSDMTIMNDDAAIMRSFLGYESGVPATFNMYIHGLFAKPLGWLSTAFPNLPWFSYLQVGLMMLSAHVIAKSIMQCFVKHRKPLWLGAVMAAVFLAIFCLRYFVSFTFTQTAALLGAAAVLQMFSIDHERGRVLPGMLGALVLVVFAYALRDVAALPALAFCALAFGYIFLSEYWKKRSLKPMLLSLAAVLVVMLAMVGLRSLEIQSSGVQDYLTWQDTRSQLQDYYGLDNVPQEAIEQAGLDEVSMAMAKEWCFLSPKLSTEAFLELEAYMDAHYPRTLSVRLELAQRELQALWRDYPIDMRLWLLAVALGLAALVAACLKKRPLTALAVLLAMLGAAACLFVLALGGRLPLRAALVGLLPMAAFVVALAPAVLRRPTASVLLCAVYAAVCLWITVPGLLPDEEAELSLGSAMADLEEYALFEPDSLFIYDKTLAGADLRAFPDYSEGMSHNITFWGGWTMRSPENEALFERFGIEEFTAETLLRDDVYIASGRVDPPPTVLLDWLQSEVGGEIEWEIYSEYGSVYIFKFVQY